MYIENLSTLSGGPKDAFEFVTFYTTLTSLRFKCLLSPELFSLLSDVGLENNNQDNNNNYKTAILRVRDYRLVKSQFLTYVKPKNFVLKVVRGDGKIRDKRNTK